MSFPRVCFKGKVFIVGSGPGDMGLVSIRALEAISLSDVILYDELANSRLLENCKADSQLVYVGKKASQHTFKQAQIEDMMIEHAKQGKTVCRLKGGDPLLFGRGGEEMEALAVAGIRYEVVPGITSAIAAPAYAGIPVTQRGLTSGVAIFTGHEDPEKEESDLNWPVIAKLDTTLVFLMGMKNLPVIVDNLLRHGMNADTPVAVIHRGTTPLQRTLIGTLKDIVSTVEKECVGAPSVIVVGSVVNLHHKLDWFEQKPLFGKKILITRTRSQASALSKGLGENGALVHELPTIEIEANKDAYPVMDKCITDISSFEWVIFTSTNGVNVFFERLSLLGLDARALGSTKICVIGPATRDELRRYSVKADLMPENYIAESVFELLRGKVNGKKILIPRSDIARRELIDLLSRDGALVADLPIYCTRRPDYPPETIEEMVLNVDLVTFTSSSTVTNFVEILGDSFNRLRGKIRAASIGPITSASVKRAGIHLACEAREYTIPGLINAIVEYYEGDGK